MASNLVVKQGDTFPPLEAVLESTEGNTTKAIDLTTATTIIFVMRKEATVFEGACAITAAKEGKVAYKWGTSGNRVGSSNAAGNTNTAGSWSIEWQITWSGGGIESVPNEGTDTLKIEPHL